VPESSVGQAPADVAVDALGKPSGSLGVSQRGGVHSHHALALVDDLLEILVRVHPRRSNFFGRRSATGRRLLEPATVHYARLTTSFTASASPKRPAG
jgi:hypothetical protein